MHSTLPPTSCNTPPVECGKIDEHGEPVTLGKPIEPIEPIESVTCDEPAEPLMLDELDRKILDIIQSAFPIVPRPYADIGLSVGIDENTAFERVRTLRTRGIIRRIGANFQSSRLGFSSTLCAAKVPHDQLDRVSAHINSYPGVTHNYLRAHAYTMWFTLIAPSREAIRDILAEMSASTGIEILDLPATKLYKIKVEFPMLPTK